jgi:hypothetical protein
MSANWLVEPIVRPEWATCHSMPVSTRPRVAIAPMRCSRWAAGPNRSAWRPVDSRPQWAARLPVSSASERGKQMALVPPAAPLTAHLLAVIARPRGSRTPRRPRTGPVTPRCSISSGSPCGQRTMNAQGRGVCKSAAGWPRGSACSPRTAARAGGDRTHIPRRTGRWRDRSGRSVPEEEVLGHPKGDRRVAPELRPRPDLTPLGPREKGLRDPAPSTQLGLGDAECLADCAQSRSRS